MPTLPHPELSRAVLIGASDFHHSGLPDLPAVRNNLTDLSRALTDQSTGILSWEHCLVIDSPETPRGFMDRLKKVTQQAEDVLVVYYAGHGIRHGTRNSLYLSVHQTDPGGLAGSAVPFEWIREEIEFSPARTRLLILDCCYSGLALGTMSAAGIEQRDIEVRGTSVVTSAPSNKVSHAPPGDRHTAFTGELISLLSTGSRIPGEPLTLASAYRGLVAAMARRQLPTPKMKAEDTSADLLLRRADAPVQEPEPAASEPGAEPQAKPRPRVAEPPLKADTPEPEAEPATPQTSPQPQVAEPPVHDQPATTQDVLPPQAVQTSRAGAEESAQPTPEVRHRNRWFLRLTLTAPVSFFLWLSLAFTTFGLVGGLVGAVFGVPPPGSTYWADLTVALAVAPVVAVSGGLLRWRRWARWRAAGGRWERAGEFAPKLERILTAPTRKSRGLDPFAGMRREPRTWLITLALAFFLLFAAVGLFTSPDSTTGDVTRTSDLFAQTEGVVAMLEGAGSCTYLLVLRWRRGAEAVSSGPGGAGRPARR